MIVNDINSANFNGQPVSSIYYNNNLVWESPDSYTAERVVELLQAKRNGTAYPSTFQPGVRIPLYTDADGTMYAELIAVDIDCEWHSFSYKALTFQQVNLHKNISFVEAYKQSPLYAYNAEVLKYFTNGNGEKDCMAHAYTTWHLSVLEIDNSITSYQLPKYDGSTIDVDWEYSAYPVYTQVPTYKPYPYLSNPKYRIRYDENWNPIQYVLRSWAQIGDYQENGVPHMKKCVNIDGSIGEVEDNNSNYPTFPCFNVR